LTSGSYVKTNDGGSTLLNWRWNGDALRSFGSSLIISNLGKIENVYMDYVSCSSSIASGVGATNCMAWSGRARADGLVFVNAAEISNCLVVRHDPTSDQFSSSFTLSANYYATNYLVAYDCNSKYGHTPTISNVGAYNDTAATNFNATSSSQIDTDKVKTPLRFTNPADGSGITALAALPSVSNNDYVTLIRIA
jgi:hypothetical protein